MSVQPSTSGTVPECVRADPLGTGDRVVATVVDSTAKADAGAGIRDVLTVDVDGSHYRVDAEDAEAYQPHGGQH